MPVMVVLVSSSRLVFHVLDTVCQQCPVHTQHQDGKNFPEVGGRVDAGQIKIHGVVFPESFQDVHEPERKKPAIGFLERTAQGRETQKNTREPPVAAGDKLDECRIDKTKILQKSTVIRLVVAAGNGWLRIETVDEQPFRVEIRKPLRTRDITAVFFDKPFLKMAEQGAGRVAVVNALEPAESGFFQLAVCTA